MPYQNTRSNKNTTNKLGMCKQRHVSQKLRKEHIIKWKLEMGVKLTSVRCILPGTICRQVKPNLVHIGAH